MAANSPEVLDSPEAKAARFGGSPGLKMLSIAVKGRIILFLRRTGGFRLNLLLLRCRSLSGGLLFSSCQDTVDCITTQNQRDAMM
jgi:hypothetical protein